MKVVAAKRPLLTLNNGVKMPPERIAENIDLFDFVLSEDELAAIDALVGPVAPAGAGIIVVVVGIVGLAEVLPIGGVAPPTAPVFFAMNCQGTKFA